MTLTLLTLNKRVISVSFLAFLFVILYSFYAHSQNIKETGRPFITNYAPNLYDGNPQNWSIEQDDRGVMYFGNSDGILEYDGYNWRLIKTPKNNVVRTLKKDKDGRIWVGGAGEIGYLAPDSIGKMTFVSLTPKIPEDKRNFDDVWGTSPVDGGVYFSTFRTLFHWHEDKMQVIEADSNSFAFYFGIDETLFKFENEGIFKVMGDDYELLPGTELITNNGLSDIKKYDEERTLFLSRRGDFFIHDGKTLKPLILEDINKIKKYRPRRVLVLPNRQLAIGTLLGGVFILDQKGRILNHYEKANGLQDNVVYELFLDNNNFPGL